MNNVTAVALSVSGLCLAYNTALAAFRYSTFEVVNPLDTIGRSATILLVNLSIYALGKHNAGAAQVYAPKRGGIAHFFLILSTDTPTHCRFCRQCLWVGPYIFAAVTT